MHLHVSLLTFEELFLVRQHALHFGHRDHRQEAGEQQEQREEQPEVPMKVHMSTQVGWK